MLRVLMVQAKPGMTLATPVLHPQRPDRILLRDGYQLDAAAIERLRNLRVGEVWVRYPSLEFIGKYICPSLMAARGQLAKVLQGIFDRMSRDASVKLDYDSYRVSIRDFVSALRMTPESALLIQNMAEGDHALLRHSSDVCYLSLLMGLKLEEYIMQQRSRLPGHRAKEVVDLGLAALLHDVGLLAMEPGAFDAWIEAGCKESDPGYREHVRLGYERLRDGLGAAASAAVLHHHQKFDGSGFPMKKGDPDQRGLMGEEIHIFARIVFAADLFDRLRFPHDGSQNRPAVRALRMIREAPIADWVDPMVSCALLHVAPAYAPGTMVTLSTREVAAVIDWSPRDPCRPTVQLLDDAESKPAGEPKRIDLRPRRDVSIVEAEGEDVSGDNFDVPGGNNKIGRASCRERV
jgi:HD-GYP domain-containing protein (c-di-GMP phosphodiesterase class II)